jgi:ATP-dependent Clp protease ATP-binding subunit ClpC
MTMSKTPFLDKYTENLTEKVLRKIDSFKLVGRDKEVDDVFAALSCMTKNSPILVGDAGVGKQRLLKELRQELFVVKLIHNFWM